MKEDPHSKKGLINDLELLEFDQNAETFEELQSQTCMGERWLREQIAKMVAGGKWQKIKKRVGNRVVDAYRRIKDNKSA